MNAAVYRTDMALGSLTLGLLALSPAHSKIAGLLWLVLCGLSIRMVITLPVTAHWSGLRALRYWILASGIVLVLWTGIDLYWGLESQSRLPADITAALRLLVGAVAAYGVAQRWQACEFTRTQITHALAMACVVALGVVLAEGRELPTHPIAWAASMALLITVLFPMALAAPPHSAKRLWWHLASFCGVLSVLLSQSRGTYLVMGWMLFVWVRSRSDTITNRQKTMLAAGALLLTTGMALTSRLPSDPLRLRSAWSDLQSTSQSQTYNTSLGARWVLWQLGWHAFQESPWIGVGARERLDRIKALGVNGPQENAQKFEHARQLGHVHNTYLHFAMDGGMVSLSGFLLSLGAMLALARSWRFKNPLACRQMFGMSFVHATTALSNVNLAHNYFAAMLSICMGLVVVLASDKEENEFRMI